MKLAPLPGCASQPSNAATLEHNTTGNRGSGQPPGRAPRVDEGVKNNEHVWDLPCLSACPVLAPRGVLGRAEKGQSTLSQRKQLQKQGSR